MSISPSNFKSAGGNTLLITLVTTGLIGFLLSSYLGLVRSQNAGTMRSQGWNATIPVVEAGLEDALTHMNVNQTATNLAFNGWVQIDGVYAVKRYLGENYYTVTISNWVVGQSPVIESRGFVKASALLTQASGPVFATAGGLNANEAYVARGVRVNLKRNGVFTKAIISKGKINVSGDVTTDSFDSTNPAYSTNGVYDPSKARDNGDVASNGSIEKVIDTSGSIEIHGHAFTGPGGTVGFGGNAAIGSHGWHAGGNTGAEPGWLRNDMNFDFRDAPLPPGYPGGGFTASSGFVDGTNYNYVLNSGHYRMPNLSMSSQDDMVVTGNASLYIVEDWSMSAQTKIVIKPGASLTVYVGKNVSLSGQVSNQSNKAEKFVVYGIKTPLFTCTDISLSGGSELTGVFYAPHAKLTLSGNSAFVGSAICAEATLSGTFDFHYDEALANFGGKGLVVTSWNEMTQDDVKRGPSL